jgi:predicted GH43/DUF377 family glycosyl hydrolase
MRFVLAALGLIAIACSGGSDGGGGGGGSTVYGWMRDAASPVVSPGPSAWDAMHVISPCVLKSGAPYRMWYDGMDAGGAFRIGYATSPNGTAWTKHAGSPVLAPAAAWESGGIGMPSVIFDGATYRMWYLGRSGGIDRIGLATSADGIAWIKSASNPVLTPGATGAWDAAGVGGPCVLFDGSLYRMWYTGLDASGRARIGYATSLDGVSWAKSAGAAVDAGPAAWEADGVEGPCVILDGGVYRMWYGGNSGADERIGYAESADGVTWTKSGAPVFRNGAGGAWDENDVWSMCVIRDGVLRMWYTGDTHAGTGRIGHATAP